MGANEAGMLALLGRSAALRLATPTLPVFSRHWCDAASGINVGTVKWFDAKKGFGFITPEDGGPDVFVHQTEVHAPGFRSLQDGESVEFKMQEQDDGRRRAAEVTGPEGS